MKIYSTGEACKRLGLQPETLFYLERRGRVAAARRLGNGKRYFTETDIKKLKQALKKDRVR